MKTFIRLIAIIFLCLSSQELVSQNGQWRPIGPWGAWVDDIAISPAEPNVLYVYAQHSVFKSTNFGRTWVETPNTFGSEFPFGATTSITAHPESSDTIFLGSTAALRMSEDGGQTWKVVIDTLGFVFGHVVFNPSNFKTSYLPAFDETIEDDIAGGGVFRSTDGGLSWQLMTTPFTGITVSDFDISSQDTSVLYAVAIAPHLVDSFIYKSVDTGKTWYALDTGLSDGEIVSLLLTSQQNAETIYVKFEERRTLRNGIIKSENGGETWTLLHSNLPPAKIHAMAVDSQEDQRVISAIGGSYLDYNSNWQTAFGLYVSQDGGLTWSQRNHTMDDSLFVDIEIDPVHPDNIYVAAPLFGVYGSEDGGITWEKRNRGDMHKIAGPFTVNPNNTNEINMVVPLGILHTDDGGSSWRRAFPFEKYQFNISVAASPFDARLLYATAKRAGPLLFLKSQDGGKSWAGRTDSVLTGSNLKLYPQLENIYATSWSGIFRSVDGGDSWVRKDVGITTPLVNGLAFNRFNPNSIYAATFDGLFKSTNAGESWSLVGSDRSQIEAVAISPFDTTTLFTSTNSRLSEFGRLRISTDEGASWHDIAVPDNEKVSFFLLDENEVGALWIVTFTEDVFTSHVFYSEDYGENWIPFSEGLPSSRISNLSLISEDSRSLFALTGEGLYRRDLVTSIEEQPSIPKQFNLFQNYPNPFSASGGNAGASASTVIKYELTTPAEVELAVYNVLGQEVITLHKGKQPAGTFSVRWDGRDAGKQLVPAGLYIIKLATPLARKVRKMILLQ